jgi:ribonucleoside-diphosphate reductase alpha chain
VKVGGLWDGIATLTSIALQYGVPLESMVRKFAHRRFEPAEFTGDPDVPLAKSIPDYVFRWLGVHYVPGNREENGVHTPQGDPSGSLGGDSPVAAPEARHEPPRALPGMLKLPAVAGGAPQRSMAGGFASFQSDAPACPECGSIMVRAGACYSCKNCGSSSGCG